MTVTVVMVVVMIMVMARTFLRVEGGCVDDFESSLNKFFRTCVMCM